MRAKIFNGKEKSVTIGGEDSKRPQMENVDASEFYSRVAQLGLLANPNINVFSLSMLSPLI
jgi:hypothetical protein